MLQKTAWALGDIQFPLRRVSVVLSKVKEAATGGAL